LPNAVLAKPIGEGVLSVTTISEQAVTRLGELKAATNVE